MLQAMYVFELCNSGAALLRRGERTISSDSTIGHFMSKKFIWSVLGLSLEGRVDMKGAEIALFLSSS